MPGQAERSHCSDTAGTSTSAIWVGASMLSESTQGYAGITLPVPFGMGRVSTWLTERTGQSRDIHKANNDNDQL